jgi:subtilisin family serine protease
MEPAMRETIVRNIRIAFFWAAAAATLLGTASAQTLAPVLEKSKRDVIPGQYVVVFKQEGTFNSVENRDSRKRALAARDAARAVVERSGGKLGFTYSTALVGFSARLTDTGLRLLRAAPGVAYIEPDQRYHFITVQPPTPPGNPPTGIDRTSERLLPLDGKYTYFQDGTGVNAYVVDSGVFVGHTDFGGRATSAFSVVSGSLGDCLGHGTHVAGTIGGTTNGIAKNVHIFSVRVGDASCAPTTSAIVSGVDWVTLNAVHPAVANVSIGGPVSSAIDTAVGNSIASGVTYAVAAGNSATNACTSSPADVAAAMTVGAVDPNTDAQANFSNFGSCVDLYAPGVNIVSDMPDGLPPLCTQITAPPSGTMSCSGTSMATPHVTGVAALVLQSNPALPPAQVWTAILGAADVTGTSGWGGIGSLSPGSPNVLLHWGSGLHGGVHDGYNDGDPHLVTVDNAHFNFQGAGEYTYLRNGPGMEIQTRETPVQTDSSFLGPDGYDGIASCVSLNTAMAARVGSHRVSFEPNISGVPDPSGMQLRIDGVLTSVGPQGINLSGGGRIVPSPVGSGGVEIDFPDGSVLVASANWWPGQQLWYLNVDIFHTPANTGLIGAIAPGSWLPALPDGSSVGPMPGTVPQRYQVLYHQFGDGWRVTNAGSLFDYRSGTSTANFTVPSWPPQAPPCKVPNSKTTVPPAHGVDDRVAQEICGRVEDKRAHEDCVFDLVLTGEKGLAKAYQDTLRLKAGATITTVGERLGGETGRRIVEFIADVGPASANARGMPKGTVQFSIDGKAVGDPIPLDEKGQAVWRTENLKTLDLPVVASFKPGDGSKFLPSSGVHEVKHMTFNR